PEAPELLAGLARLLFRLRPVAVEHLELGAMHAADARIAGGAVATHPALALGRPLAGPLEVADIAAARQHSAVDVARGPPLELTRGGCGGRLVEVGEALLHLADEDLGHALEAHRRIQDVGEGDTAGGVHGLVGECDALLPA